MPQPREELHHRGAFIDLNALYPPQDNVDGGRPLRPIPLHGPWPQRPSVLDATQTAAARAALTSDLSLIQGPPGTGKTYTTLRLLAVLLQNRERLGLARGPILLLAYTNHALDQLSRGVLQMTQKFVRIGSNTQDETIKEYTLHRWRETDDVAAMRLSNPLHGAKKRLEEDLMAFARQLAAPIVPFKFLSAEAPQFARALLAGARRSLQTEASAWC